MYHVVWSVHHPSEVLGKYCSNTWHVYDGWHVYIAYHTHIYIFVDFLPTLVCLDDYCDAVMAWMQTSLRELTTLGIKNAENLAIPSVRNDVILFVSAITFEISSRVHCRVWVPDQRTKSKSSIHQLGSCHLLNWNCCLWCRQLFYSQ